MNPKLIAFLFLFLGAAIDTAGDVVMKIWVVSGRKTVFIIGLIVYMAGLVLLSLAYRYENIAVASTIFVTFNVIILSVVSWIFFKEGLTLMQISGILLAIVAVGLLEFGGK